MSDLTNIFTFASLLCIGSFGLCICADSSIEYAPTVQLKDGQVRGIVQDGEHNGHKIHFYQGIRYGRAQRFMKPQPVEPWPGVYDATTYRDACVQFGSTQRVAWLLNYTNTESDDCLFLNVWRPQTESANRSVMVWIHGGGFESGTIFTTMFDGRHLAEQGDIVLVAINYRLGPFGFLYSGTADAPGNVGMHDQLLALKWVRENIAHFGGDPNQVTIFGESAGSMSVGALILSPLAKGLFQRAIMQSGAPNSYLTESTTKALTKTKMIANKLNCSASEMADIVKCLKSKPIHEMVTATDNDFARNELFSLVHGEEFLPIEPVEALKSGKVNQGIDLLYGLNANEGSIFIPLLMPQLLFANLTKNSLKDAIVEALSKYEKLNWNEVSEYYVDKLKQQQPTQDELLLTLAKATGDYVMDCPTILFAEQLSLASPSSSYYSYRLMKGVDLPTIPKLPWIGVPHAADLFFLFPSDLIKQDPESVRLSGQMIQAWTQFAKTGHPIKMDSTQWTSALPHSTNHLNEHPTTEYMSLNPLEYKMVNKFYSEVCNNFWKPKIFMH